MLKSEIVSRLMFDYESLSAEAIGAMAGELGNKLLRWLAINHPDNRTRFQFFRMTNVSVGKDTVINSNLIISDDYEPLVTIGERVAISPQVTIIAASGPNNSRLNDIPAVQNHLIVKAPVCIEDDAWIGTGVILMPGVTIGRASIIGAGSVVTHDISPGWVAAGVPARMIRRIDDPKAVPGNGSESAFACDLEGCGR